MLQQNEPAPSLQVLPSGEGEHWLVGGETTTVKVSGRDTEGRLLVLETYVEPGGGTSELHRHRFVEFFRVLEGRFEFGTADVTGQRATVAASAGDTVHVPSSAWHSYQNVGETPGRLLTIFATDAIEQLAHAVGERIEDPAHPAASGAPPSAEGAQRAVALMAEHAIERFPAQGG